MGKQINRYDPRYLPFSKGMIKDDLGVYVKYEDYMRTHSQLQKEQEENAKLKSHIRDLQAGIDTLTQSI